MADTRSKLIKNYKYEVLFTGKNIPTISAGFSSISGLSDETEVIDYREGTDQARPRRLIGQNSYGDVTLERGMSQHGNAFNEWRRKVRRLMEVDDNTDGGKGPRNQSDIEANVSISIIGEGGISVARWSLLKAWPSALEISDISSDGSEVMIESVTLVCEEQKRFD